MRKISPITFFLLFAVSVQAQKITNMVLVSDTGIVENIGDAKYFIAVKTFRNRFERVTYNVRGPLISLETYSDENMTILEGNNLVYSANGKLTRAGYYSHNKKEKTWEYYNDAFKVIKREFYENGMLVKTEDPDTIKTIAKLKFADEKVAQFKKGDDAWQNYLSSKIHANVFSKTAVLGTVIGYFEIDTEGNTNNIYLRKSIEFNFDEEVLGALYAMPKWKPAFQNGKNTRSYQLLPITFTKIY